MDTVFEFLSELWLRFAEKINFVIFSFVFFWGTLPFMYHFEEKLYNHLRHLHYTTGNSGYYVLQIMLFLVSCIVDFMWFIMPFGIASEAIHGEKENK